jgi:N-terminal domain of anti-restriction factor ArdC
MPTCQVCISKMAQVTDKRSIDLKPQIIESGCFKNIFHGMVIALCHHRFLRLEMYHHDTLKGEMKMSNQVYGYITDKIMEELERGCVPWHKPWKTPDGVRVPMNYASKKPIEE